MERVILSSSAKFMILPNALIILWQVVMNIVMAIKMNCPEKLNGLKRGPYGMPPASYDGHPLLNNKRVCVPADRSGKIWKNFKTANLSRRGPSK
jgi:hypothetical protein